ncbi:unnamed protein product [Protopolystoma xenopodis]|uniref:Uncharacterized protein n=1 Tax=Protopolystoma xenopodis TaxID=117903 RepID=A0A448WNF0_9PLAT|nr:unnamed protein product [Protopolystoma xenopodis]
MVFNYIFLLSLALGTSAASSLDPDNNPLLDIRQTLDSELNSLARRLNMVTAMLQQNHSSQRYTTASTSMADGGEAGEIIETSSGPEESSRFLSSNQPVTAIG